MKIDKEYPATHSMSTAWYCVDEDDNVALFSMEDNGPIPHEAINSQYGLADLCFYEPVSIVNGIKTLNLTDDQVLSMVEGLLHSEVPDDYYWSDEIVQIDPKRESDFLLYMQMVYNNETKDRFEGIKPTCLSQKYGIYIVNLSSYNFGDGMKNIHAKYLFENGIMLKYCELPWWDMYEFDEVDSKLENKCPYYIYTNDWDPSFPHDRKSVPAHPVKLNQIPKEWQKKIIRVPLHFSDSREVQLQLYNLCYSTPYNSLETEDGFIYVKAELSTGLHEFVLNYDMSLTEIKKLGIENNQAAIDALITKQSYILSKKEVERLKKLPINKDYKDND